MNAFGVKVDTELIEGALTIGSISHSELIGEAGEITDLSNPNSTAQLKAWMEKELTNYWNRKIRTSRAKEGRRNCSFGMCRYSKERQKGFRNSSATGKNVCKEIYGNGNGEGD